MRSRRDFVNGYQIMPPGNNVDTTGVPQSSISIYLTLPGPTLLGVVRGYVSVAPISAVRNALCTAPLQFAACHSRSTAEGGHVRRGKGAGPPSRLSRSRSHVNRVRCCTTRRTA